MDQFAIHSEDGRRWLLIEAIDLPFLSWYVIKELK